ncbi:MAG: cell division protein FtsQ/DivIB [Bacteroidales bacterium]|nr:cell division protein FtsQ/DivIB [Bacteroidales bacterium]
MILKRILFVLLLFLVIGYAVFALFYFPGIPASMKCDEIIVNVKSGREGAPLISREGILASVRAAKCNPLGKTLSEINTEDIEHFLEQNQLIKEAVVYYSLTGNVVISVSQREPLFRVMGESGNFFVDRDGAVMPEQNNFVAKLPVVSGYVEKSFAANELRNFVLYLQNDEFWNEQIEQIYVLPNRDVELIPKVGSHRILMGPLTDVDKKLNRLMKFYRKALNKVGWNRYSVINLKYDKQVVCTKK